jgi:hypothetical protein
MDVPGYAAAGAFCTSCFFSRQEEDKVPLTHRGDRGKHPEPSQRRGSRQGHTQQIARAVRPAVRSTRVGSFLSSVGRQARGGWVKKNTAQSAGWQQTGVVVRRRRRVSLFRHHRRRTGVRPVIHGPWILFRTIVSVDCLFLGHMTTRTASSSRAVPATSRGGDRRIEGGPPIDHGVPPPPPSSFFSLLLVDAKEASVSCRTHRRQNSRTSSSRRRRALLDLPGRPLFVSVTSVWPPGEDLSVPSPLVACFPIMKARAVPCRAGVSSSLPRLSTSYLVAPASWLWTSAVRTKASLLRVRQSVRRTNQRTPPAASR